MTRFIFVISSFTVLIGCISQHPHHYLNATENHSSTVHPLDRLNEASISQPTTLMEDEVCAFCHPRQFEEFVGSTMKYSLASPVFNTLELTLNQISNGHFSDQGESSGFCIDCHGPRARSLGLAAQADEATDVYATTQEISLNQGGIGCDVCHRAPHNLQIGEVFVPTPGVEKLGPLFNPQPNDFHKSAAQSDSSRALIRSSELCGSCHDVRPNQPDLVTGEPFLRSENLFSEWANSPWANPNHPQNPMRGQPGITGIHDDQRMLGERVTCQDCHMSLYPYRRFQDEVSREEFAQVDPREFTRKLDKLYPTGYVASPIEGLPNRTFPKRRVSTHHFTGVSTPLIPFPIDTTQMYEWDTWRDEQRALVDEYGLPLRTFQRRVDLLKAATHVDLDDIPSQAQRGTQLSIPIWVENVGAGHNVPAGFSQERELWLSIELIDQGQSCDIDLDCQAYIAPRFFLDSPNKRCIVHTQTGAVDPALPEQGSWEDAARRERSGICAESGYCVLYRSGYLVDLDGDGHVADEDLRHQLIELDTEKVLEQCVIPGPDVDQRPSGLNQGLTLFTNQLQQLDKDSNGQPIESNRARVLAPRTSPYVPSSHSPPVLNQPNRERRSLFPTEQARYELFRFAPLPKSDREGNIVYGFGRQASHLLHANHAHNGQALKPFEPRLALYDIEVPQTTIGPLQLTVALNFRFMSPRLLRLLATRHPDRINETFIDRGLDIVQMFTATRHISIHDRLIID